MKRGATEQKFWDDVAKTIAADCFRRFKKVEAPTQCFTQNVPCVCFDVGECQCGREERILRHVSAGHAYPAFTQAERDWCKQEITSVEGYSEKDAEGSDADVARTVIHAWVDYCRDKGLL